MCNHTKMLRIANDMFSPDTVVSLGTRHLHTKHPETADITVLLGGRIEFNSYYHRRDMVDVMLHYKLYVVKLDNGRYRAGVHGTDYSVIKDLPTTAITEVAYHVVAGRNGRNGRNE